MGFLRSERFSAAALLLAAALGLVLANSPLGPILLELKHAHPWQFAGLDLSVGHWVSDGLLAVFFFIVAVELKRELVIGELNSPAKAALPAIAAVGGVLVPAGIYLGLTVGSGFQEGWPIPTATDIAFAMGVLAVIGKHIPTRVRVFLLALAVLDDLVAILIIAVFFTTQLDVASLALAAVAVAAFAIVGRALRPRSPWILARRPQWPIIAVMVVLAVLAWYFTYNSGVHATIAGVALGLLISRRPGGRTAHVLEPFSNAVVLPVFAFFAALVLIPAVSPTELSPVFWGIVIALPLGKLLGITAAGMLGSGLAKRRDRPALEFGDILAVAALGGIGFTVSLLMNELAFKGAEEIVDEGTLAVLVGSAIAIVLSVVIVGLRSRHYAKLSARPAASVPTAEKAA